jgi:ribosomal-protein-alanine N-acetyltransferase
MSDQFRWLIRKDLQAVLAMDYAASPDEFWTEAEWIRQLRQRNIIGMVAERDNETVVGACLFEVHRHHVVITKFVVDPACRGQGVGSLMLDRLKQKLDQERRRSLVFEDVSLKNLDLLMWLKSKGFLAVFFDCHDDLISMEYQVEDSLFRA